MRTETGISSDGTNGLIVRGAALVLLAGALLYLGLKVFNGGDTVDFKFIHLAGELWLEGSNPYSALYAETGETRYAGMNRPRYQPYPPHWWGIATTSALMSHETAGSVWRMLMALCLIGGCLALHGTVRQIAGTAQWGRTWAMLVMAAAMSATAIALTLGQTSCLLFLGVCLYIRAFVARDRWLMGAALVVIMLKPNFGLALSLFLAPSLFWWRSLIGAALAVIVLSLPAILPFGLWEVIQGYLQSLQAWEADPPNSPENTTGIRNLAYVVAGATVPAKWLAISASLLALSFGILLQRRAKAENQLQYRSLMLGLLLAVLLLFVPLHTYDMMLVVPFIALGAALPFSRQVLLAIPLILAFRPNNLEQVLGLVRPGEPYFVGGTTAAVAAGLLTILLVCFVHLAGQRGVPAKS